MNAVWEILRKRQKIAALAIPAQGKAQFRRALKFYCFRERKVTEDNTTSRVRESKKLPRNVGHPRLGAPRKQLSLSPGREEIEDPGKMQEKKNR